MFGYLNQCCWQQCLNFKDPNESSRNEAVEVRCSSEIYIEQELMSAVRNFFVYQLEHFLAYVMLRRFPETSTDLKLLIHFNLSAL